MLHVEIGFWLSGGQRGQRCVASGPARGLSATDLKLDFGQSPYNKVLLWAVFVKHNLAGLGRLGSSYFELYLV